MIICFSMCINKTTLVNQAYRPYNLYTPLYIDVPCGHCWQCNITKVNSYSFRLLSDITKYDYPTSFVTNSYSDLFLPYIFYYSPSGNVEKISCWNREHVKRYFKRIRRKLQYYFGLDSSSFKYFLTCERGSSDSYISDTGKLRIATNRPHYHIISYLTCSKDLQPIRQLPDVFYKSDFFLKYSTILLGFWNYLLSNEWFYGNTDHQDLTRDLVARVLYVCKYVCKDVSDPVNKISLSLVRGIVDPEFNFCSDLWHIQLIPCSKDSDGAFLWYDNYYKVRKGFKKFPTPIKLSSLYPRVMSSVNIGMSFVEDKDVKELELYLSYTKKVTLPSTKSSTIINLPNYYFRKLCKSTKKYNVGDCYVREHVLPSGFVNRIHVKSLASKHLKFEFDNVVGIYFKSVDNVSTISTLTNFGKSVNRLKFKNYVSSSLITLRYYLCHYDLFCKYLTNYSLLPKSFHCSDLDSFLSFKDSFNKEDLPFSFLSFRNLAKVLATPFNKYTSLPFDRFKNLLLFKKLVDVCTYYLAHLQHLKNDAVYKGNFYSSATDNPELFLPHYLS